ncbi:hypothetical protein Patl1_01709 [Pistacia atlantica]|uniref:Uncharacterized protein n=1 Tax=Pistacia atlantica TaxID=434234 RepID=A0ACC1C637_9ROSI|nr:hypothetical protein Patl1_01709 [Pistacia atlantica]
MPQKDLELPDALGCTALHYAAVGGSIRACRALDVVCYLSSVTTDGSPGHPFSGNLAGILACSLAAGGFHATAKDDDGLNILDALALRPWDFQSGMVGWPEKLLWNCIGLLAPGIKEVHDAKLTHKFALELVKSVVVAFSPLSDSQIYEFFLQSDIITKAASSGIVEIVKICLQMVPDIFWLSTDQQTLLKVAVQYRQEKILTLVHNTVVYNKFTSPKPIDEFKNSILHLAARLAPPHHLRVVSGAALQMQREVQWFKVTTPVKSTYHVAYLTQLLVYLNSNNMAL